MSALRGRFVAAASVAAVVSCIGGLASANHFGGGFRPVPVRPWQWRAAAPAYYGWGFAPYFYGPIVTVVPAPVVVADAAPGGPPPPPVPGFHSFEPRLGIGLSGVSSSLHDASDTHVGGARASLRYWAERGLALEVTAGQLNAAPCTCGDLTERPLLGSAYVYLFGHTLAPYLVVSAGVDWFRSTFAGPLETATAAEGQAGVGLELRLGRHFAFDGDLRYVARRLMGGPAGGPSAAVTPGSASDFASASGSEGSLAMTLFF